MMADSNIFYNSHHSPAGAFASFTLGFKGAYGGLGIELAGPARQNVYVGAESKAAGRFQALPFYEDQQKAGASPAPVGADTEPVGASPAPVGINTEPVGAALAAALLADSDIPDGGQSRRRQSAVLIPFRDDEIAREISPACDVWRAGDLEFAIYTPHMPVPDPGSADPEDVKKAVIPAVFVELTLDNAGHPRPRKAFFGYEGNDPYAAMRRVGQTGRAGGNIDEDAVAKIAGIGQGRITGIFTDGASADCALAFSADELLADDIADRLPFGLGTTGLVMMTAGAGEKRAWRFAVCFYRDGIVTAGKKASYLYTSFYKDIESVARFGLDNFDFYKEKSADFDKTVFQSESRLSDTRRFLLSQSIKSYYGSTQLLVDEDSGEPLWVVVEGAYRMINTLDLAVDHLFFEMRANPWAVRSVLNQYADGYCYDDEVKNAAGERFPGGISFAHDMGVANVFSPRGKSSYELSGLKGCYSYMTQEQLANWILCAGVYWAGSGDDLWLKERQQIIGRCLASMANRDGADDGSRDGVMDLDSCKTGGGAEITTYDNVDKALGQARRSGYIAVKCWAAYLSLEKMFGALGLKPSAGKAAEQAKKCADTVLKYVRPDGTIPAILEDGNRAVTLSLAEGLVYPYVMGMFDDPGFINKYGDFTAALKTHFKAALENGCRFSDGSWKMSKTSDNSWLSKTFLFQSVAEKIFGMDADARADGLHASWLLDPENAPFAFSDQMMAGKACGSKYYPRGVVCILWV